MIMTPTIDPAMLTDLAGAWARLMAPVAIKGSLVLGLFAILNFSFQRASASTRHLLWTLGLAGTLLLPILGSGLPSWPILDLSRLAPDQNSAEGTIGSAALTPPALSTTEEPTLSPSPTPTSPPMVEASRQTTGATSLAGLSGLLSLPATTWIFFGWQAGILLLVGTLLWAAARLRGLERNARALCDDSWNDLLESLCGELEIARMPRLMQSHKGLTPMAWGARQATILLPADCGGWTGEKRRQVLLHELAHVKRRDCLTQIAAQMACLIYWFNPLVWMAARQMRIERERACDDQVLVAGAKASSYASNLLDIASSRASERRALAVSLGMARRSQISGRLMAVLDSRRRRLAPGRYVTVIAMTLTLAIVLPLAVLGPTAHARAVQSGETSVSITSDTGLNPIRARWGWLVAQAHDRARP
jgi:beta-lactamase regulating signal transducer with metallopeptidase domain